MLVLMAVMGVLGLPLNTGAAPQGIFSFEFAGTVEKATEILASWKAQEVLPYAAFIQGLDFLFLVVYSTTLALGCVWAKRVICERGWPLVSPGVPLAWGQWLAAGFDAVENVALGALLFGRPAAPWPQVAWGCAAVKFTLIFLGAVYLFYGLAVSSRATSPHLPRIP
jgi:hypothetical protein